MPSHASREGLPQIEPPEALEDLAFRFELFQDFEVIFVVTETTHVATGGLKIFHSPTPKPTMGLLNILWVRTLPPLLWCGVDRDFGLLGLVIIVVIITIEHYCY